ncbi:hypothetical protein [Gorillibacterium sp. CAU 1737]|uniref:hypothetical protein n=1 Tax=Gorillibacterium sp. CAU 1737 TaxID=3140362 RepID=UPI003260721A
MKQAREGRRSAGSRLRNEKGGVALLLLALLAVVSLTLLWLASVNWSKQTLAVDKAKPILDLATRAASLDIDEEQLAEGKLLWNEAAGRATFYEYLHRNLYLDGEGDPLPGSFLSAKPNVLALEFVSAPAYPSTLHRQVPHYVGTKDAVLRTVDVTIHGPSVLAVVEFRISSIGRGGEEGLLISSVSSIRFR